MPFEAVDEAAHLISGVDGSTSKDESFQNLRLGTIKDGKVERGAARLGFKATTQELA